MDVKAEVQGREELKGKLEESQRREEVMEVALKAADVENKRLAVRNESLTDSKEELQRRFAQLADVRNFWTTEGAGLVVRTCLRSPEVYDWLLEFAGVMMNMGYSTGVKAVYTAHLPERDPQEFKDFAKGNVDAGEQIKRRVERFRHGFLEYLAANPGLSFGELRGMDTAAYRRLDRSYGGIAEAPVATSGATQKTIKAAAESNSGRDRGKKRGSRIGSAANAANCRHHRGRRADEGSRGADRRELGP